MQDGPPPHIARSVNQLLRHHFFDDRIISRKFLSIWSPRSLDIWMRGYLKGMVYWDPILSLSDFKESTEHHVQNILPQFILLSTVKHAILRFPRVTDNDGRHIEHVLYTFIDYLCVLNKAIICLLGVVFEV